MSDLSPSGHARRGRIPPEDQEGRRRGRFGLLSRFKRKPTPRVDSSTSETHSTPSQEVSLNSEASPSTLQVADSPPLVTSSTQRRTGTSTEAPPLIPEKDEGDRRNLRITDESSIELLQGDLDFVLKQHAIMDQIMVDQSSSRPLDSNDRSMRYIPSTDDVTSRSSVRQQNRPSSNCTSMNLDDMDQEEDNDDFLHFLNDPVVLEEQRRIMNDIASLSPHSLTGHAEPPPLKPSPDYHASSSAASAYSSPTRDVNDEIMGYIEDAATFMSESVPAPMARQDQVLHHVRRASSEPSPRLDLHIITPFPRRAESAPLTVQRVGNQSPPQYDRRNQYTTQYEQDAQVRVYQGKRIQVRGTNHTWKKIAKGNATLVQCPVCSTILQVGASARLLFCTKCNEVSPISVHRNSSMDYRADGLIAVVVQQQEVDVAFAMKMARNAPPKK